MKRVGMDGQEASDTPARPHTRCQASIHHKNIKKQRKIQNAGKSKREATMRGEATVSLNVQINPQSGYKGGGSIRRESYRSSVSIEEYTKTHQLMNDDTMIDPTG